jgi:UDP-glucose 4-epimerase
MAKYLITGVAGFIGSHLADALVASGESVRGLDNFSTGVIQNLSGLRGKIDLHEIDLRNAEGVAAACVGMDYVLHLGALPSVPRSVKDPRASHESNVDGTFNLLEGARAAGVKRVVYAASSSAYGNQLGFPRKESMVPAPIAPYPAQKVMGELYMHAYTQVYGLETVSLRYFNVFGPRQVPDSPYSGVMAKFILQMMRGERPIIYGDGEQGRDFTFVDNAVQATLLAVKGQREKVAGRVFNVACGERHTLNEAYRGLAQLLQFDRDPEYGQDRRGDVRDSLADISAATEAFGYRPHVGFDEGLRKTVEWYVRQTEIAARVAQQVHRSGSVERYATVPGMGIR